MALGWGFPSPSALVNVNSGVPRLPRLGESLPTPGAGKPPEGVAGTLMVTCLSASEASWQRGMLWELQGNPAHPPGLLCVLGVAVLGPQAQWLSLVAGVTQRCPQGSGVMAQAQSLLS